jgi:hypothetical protein
MKYCARVDEIEELGMGLLTDAEAERARGHLAACESCQIEHRRFVEERALFARRADVTGAAPYFDAAALDAVVFVDTKRRATVARVARAFVAIAACVAAIATAGWSQRSKISADCGARERESVDRSAESFDEPLSCDRPVSGFVRVAQHTSDERLACVAADHAMCEEPLASWQRVTSSVATP